MKIVIISIVLILIVGMQLNAQKSVTIDTTVKFQTIEGWGHGGDLFSNLGGFFALADTNYTHDLCLDYLDYIIDELGLTGSRIWEVGPRPDGTGMDNGDCDSLDWSKFQSDIFFGNSHQYVKYFSDRIKAKGYNTSFYSSPTYPTFATAFKPWVLYHPGERAQQIWGNSLYWKNKYDIDMNYAVIYNEPNSPITSEILVDDAKAVGERFAKLGLKTKVQFAEGVTPQSNWNYISPVLNDSILWKNIGRISYHNYGNYNSPDQYRPLMRDFANSIGITTAQTEMGDPNFDNLYSDLILGGVSYWEVAFSGSNTLPIQPGQTQFSHGTKYFRLRQLLHYVRPGDVRISAISTDSNLHVLAFSNKGKITTIIENLNSTISSVTINRLNPGSYGVSQSDGNLYQELGIKTVASDGILTINAPGNSAVTTIYPYLGVNHSPTIVAYNTDKGYIFSPTNSVNLSVYAVDEEKDNLTYQWSVFKQPTGSKVAITNPTSANSSVTGISEAGMYIFNIDVSDGKNVSSKKVYLNKYDSNPPALIGQSGFRFAQPYGLVFSYNKDTCHANIELPTNSCILQVGIGDLSGSDFSGRGKWSLVSAPVGSKVKVDTTIYIYVSIRAQVTNMDVPGDYVFACEVTNPPYPNLKSAVICTVHPQSSSPIIESISANPQILSLPDNTVQLKGKTSDPENDLLRHWWSIKSAPNEAKINFEHQGLAMTNASGLSVPGNYIFTLRCFDDLHIVTKDVFIFVTTETNEVADLENKSIGLYPNPVTDYLQINSDKTDKIEIFSTLGLKVLESEWKDKISVLGLLPGVYFVKVGCKVSKFVKM